MKYLDYIFDGAMGTYYASCTNHTTASELANISDAKKIVEIHQEYIAAGVNAIKTNTFGLNGSLIADKRYRDLLIRQAISNARSAINGHDVKMFADIGPINIVEDNEYLEIVKVFEQEGCTNFIFETLLEYDSIKEVVKYIKRYIKDSVVLVSFGVNQDGYTQLGNHYQELIKEASKDADYIGLNCICGPAHMYQLIAQVDTAQYPITVMPNAGYPNNKDNSFTYNAEYFSDYILKFVALEVKIVGACCGSTPEHMKQVIEKIMATKIEFEKPEITHLKQEENKSLIKKLLLDKTKIIAAEVAPPKTVDATKLIESAFQIKQAGAHLLTLVDSPLAQTRCDSLMMANKIKREVGIDVLPHLSCRDKNQIAIKGGLMAANIEGVNNVLAISGDAIAKIDRDYNKGVFCFNSMNLINYISELNKDTFYDNPYLIAGALNINALNFSEELKRAHAKLKNNVDYFITQSAFTQDAIANIKEAALVLNAPIIVGLYPVASYRNALFLSNEVKGITIPTALINQLKETEPENYQEVSVNFTTSIIDEVYDYCAGFYISTPLHKTSYVIDIIRYLKNKE